MGELYTILKYLSSAISCTPYIGKGEDKPRNRQATLEGCDESPALLLLWKRTHAFLGSGTS